MKKIRVALLISVLPVLFGSAYYLIFLLVNEESAIADISTSIDSAVSITFAECKLDPSAVTKQYVRKEKEGLQWKQVEIVAEVSENISLTDLGDRLKSAVDIPLVNVNEQQMNSADVAELQFSITYKELPLYQILLKQRISPPIPVEPENQPDEEQEEADDRPMIALIVDDVGYDVERALELLNLRSPMTISIFPQLLYSRHIAKAAHKMGYEIMMHLPMEPGENLRRNPGFVMQSMSREELYWILDRDLDSIPHVSGVNNHQGSKMTADEHAMTLVVEYLSEKDLYFIDSRTTNDSVAHKVAMNLGLKSAENDVFLDNEKDLEYIKQRISILMDKADAGGKAIGICHVHPITIQALREMLPLVEQEGFRLVYASEVVE